MCPVVWAKGGALNILKKLGNYITERIFPTLLLLLLLSAGATAIMEIRCLIVGSCPAGHDYRYLVMFVAYTIGAAVVWKFIPEEKPEPEKGEPPNSFLASLGWGILRLLLGVPAVAGGNAVLPQYQESFEPLALPVIAPMLGKARSEGALIFLFLLMVLLAWVATVRLAEILFRFKFPQD